MNEIIEEQNIIFIEEYNYQKIKKRINRNNDYFSLEEIHKYLEKKYKFA